MGPVQLQKGDAAATAAERTHATGGVASTSAQASPSSSEQFRKAIPATGTIERIDEDKGVVSVRGENDQRIENLNVPAKEVQGVSQGDRVTALVAIARGTQPRGGPSTSGAAGGGPH